MLARKREDFPPPNSSAIVVLIASKILLISLPRSVMAKLKPEAHEKENVKMFSGLVSDYYSQVTEAVTKS